MRLSYIHVEQFRNIVDIELEPAKRYNIIRGPNGCGKTSLIEAIYFLSTARSFRTRKAKEVIQRGKDRFRVTGRLVEAQGRQVALGIERSRVSIEFRSDGQRLRNASQLASQLPVILITPDSHEVLQGGPRVRRRMLDWGLFHVEQAYLENWHRFHRLLRHRNALLKGCASKAEVHAWDKEFVASALWLDRRRTVNVSRFGEVVAEIIKDSLDGELEIRYESGWDLSVDYQGLLMRRLAIDRERGYTVQGPHRAELTILVDGKMASGMLSRGQSKLLIAGLRIAQGCMVRDEASKEPVVLLDDLAAELDEERRERLAEMIRSLSGQVFVTGTDLSLLPESIRSSAAVFHVERGSVAKVLQ